MNQDYIRLQAKMKNLTSANDEWDSEPIPLHLCTEKDLQNFYDLESLKNDHFWLNENINSFYCFPKDKNLTLFSFL